MADRFCHCTHSRAEHSEVRDDFNRDGGYTGKCNSPGCECKRYNFDFERWARADEREKVMKEFGLTEK